MGFRISGLGFRFFGFRVYCFVSSVWDLGFRVEEILHWACGV